MSNFVVGLLAGLGTAAYIYNIIYKNTGGDTKNALVVGGVAGLFAMIALITLLSILF